MYEAVRPFPAGQATSARFAVRAGAMGYDGIVVLADPGRTGAGRLADRFDVDVVAGAMVAEREQGALARTIQSTRPAVELLCVEAGTPGLRRFATTRDRVDVLLDPIGEHGPIAHTIAKRAADHGVAIALDLEPLLTRRGADRSRYARDLRLLARVLDHYDVPSVVTGRPDSHLAMRAPRELVAVGAAVGIDDAFLERGLETWGAIVERNRAVRDDSFIEPGVRREE